MALRYPDPPLTDEVILLRPWDEPDLPLLQRVSEDEYVATIEHLPVPFHSSRGRQWIAAQHRSLEEERGWAFAIVEVQTDEAIGGLGINFRHPPGAAEPGAWIIQEKRNQGFAERATRLLCRWALTAETGIVRVQATVEPWNVASQRVLEKLGFVREGLLRSYSSWRGSRQDVFLYSLLRSDLDDAPAAAGRAIYLLTGPMAAGKTTVAHLLAARFERGVHVEGDFFRRSVVADRHEMTPNPSPEALAQLHLRYRLAAQAADTYFEEGFTVVLEDVIAGHLLPEIVSLIQSRPLHVVVLLPTCQSLLSREEQRDEIGYSLWTPEQLYDTFANETPRLGLWLDTSNQTPEQTVEAILAQTH